MTPRGGAREGAGRPSTDPDQRRSETIRVRLTQGEVNELGALALDEPLSSYIRTLIQRHLARARRRAAREGDRS